MTPSSELKDIGKIVVLVGAGKMGAAMLQGWLARGLDPAKLAVLEPQPAEDIKALAARGVSINPAKTAEAGAIVIAVKPQAAQAVVPPLAAMVGASTVVVSIMAGKTLGFLED